jgi:hypothetical protein
MPVWLRKFYLQKIIDYNEDKGAKHATQQVQKSQNKNTVLRPAIKPS